jgi:hypothetical protein
MINFFAGLLAGGFIAFWVGLRVGFSRGSRYTSTLANDFQIRKANESAWPRRNDLSENA